MSTNTTVMKVSILIDESGKGKPGDELAFKYVGEPDDGWQDPWGGFFVEEEQAQLDRVAAGTARSVDLSVGTEHEHTVFCRLAATFI